MIDIRTFGFTGNIQAFLDNNEEYQFPPGDIVLPPGLTTGICKMIRGHGAGTRLRSPTGYDGPLIEVVSNDVTLDNLLLVGQGANSGYLHEDGVYVWDRYGLILQNVRCKNLGGAGFHCKELQGSNDTYTHCVTIKGLYALKCNMGAWFDDRGEYVQWEGGSMFGCNRGTVMGAGNNFIKGVNYRKNAVQIDLVPGLNSGHGEFAHCNINHVEPDAATGGIGVRAVGQIYGHRFSCCNWYEAPLWIEDSVGIVLCRGDFDPSWIHLKDSTVTIENMMLPMAHELTLTQVGTVNLIQGNNRARADGSLVTIS